MTFLISTHKFGIKYTHLMWGMMLTLMILFIIDRFTWNLWPMHFTHNINFQEDDWSAIMFYIFGFVCGRMLIISSTFIWILQCRCCWNFFFEHKPKWIIVEDIMQENNAIHYRLGWLFIALPMVIHPWIVFVPLIQNYTFNMFDTWWRPVDPMTNFYVENIHHHSINVSINDLYALIMTTFVFIILFPLSLYSPFKQKHWTIAHFLHCLGALIYGIEMLRTPFTIHCWFISFPFIIMYLCDRN
eukprot:292441_1